MQIQYDGHVHSHHSPCGHRDAALASLAEKIRETDLRGWGLADHLFTERNVADLEAARAEYDALDGRDGIVFAVEASVLRNWDIDQTRQTGNIWGYHAGGPEDELALYLPDELVERLGIRYVIAGAHWCLGAAMTVEDHVRSYHRQNMFLACHPKVNIIAHPWWWRPYYQASEGEQCDFFWLEDFSAVPQSMHREFAAAARENGKRVEVNAGAIYRGPCSDRWREQYFDFLTMLREAGCVFSAASDSHSPDYARWPEELPERLAARGFTDRHVWAGPDA